MDNLQKYTQVFIDTLDADEATVATLEYQTEPAWDSVGHMQLIAALEDAFDIMMDTDDIIGFDSFEHGKEILAKYDISFD